MSFKILHISLVALATFFFTGCAVSASAGHTIGQKQIQNNSVFYSHNRPYSNGEILSDMEFKNSLSDSIDKYINTKSGGDCSGFIAVLNKEHDSMFFDNSALNSFFTKGRGKSQAIFNYYSSKNKIAYQNPRVGDLIFFQNTTRSTKKTKNGHITHVGIVSEIYKDGRVRFVHNTRGKNQNGYMNLNKKDIFQSGNKMENSYIISCSNNRTSCLTSNRFAGYGKVAQNKF